jgi:hypothetical protein
MTKYAKIFRLELRTRMLSFFMLSILLLAPPGLWSQDENPKGPFVQWTRLLENSTRRPLKAEVSILYRQDCPSDCDASRERCDRDDIR